jgi:cytochrome c oxidase subunit III
MSNVHTLHGPVAHQFDDLVQQREADELGMWTFLCTEILFFGGVFLAYALYRIKDEAGFAEASATMDLTLGTINTAVLLCSSLAVALAVHAAETSRRGMLTVCLAATMILGAAFLGIKFYEYYEKFREHHMPLFGLPFDYHGKASSATAELFFDLYFVMTGIHAIHMLIGMGALTFLFVKALRGGLLGDYSTPVHITGLYWHFVDIVWVFLFPFLYLIGARH